MLDKSMFRSSEGSERSEKQMTQDKKRVKLIEGLLKATKDRRMFWSYDHKGRLCTSLLAYSFLFVDKGIRIEEGNIIVDEVLFGVNDELLAELGECALNAVADTDRVLDTLLVELKKL